MQSALQVMIRAAMFIFAEPATIQDAAPLFAIHEIRLITWTGYDATDAASLSSVEYFVDREHIGTGEAGQESLIRLLQGAKRGTMFVAVYRQPRDEWPDLRVYKGDVMEFMYPQPPNLRDAKAQDKVLNDLSRRGIIHMVQAFDGKLTAEVVHKRNGNNPPPIYLVWSTGYDGIRKIDTELASYSWGSEVVGTGRAGFEVVLKRLETIPEGSFVLGAFAREFTEASIPIGTNSPYVAYGLLDRFRSITGERRIKWEDRALEYVLPKEGRTDSD